VRNQIRKAQKSQLRVEIAGSDRLPVFYQIFARNMRDLGTPVYGRRFFTEVLATFPSATRIFTVWLGDRPVAASIVYWHGSTFEVPWASSLSEFRHLCGNTLLYWEMISFAVREGFRTFDFGRATPGEGTYQFKRQWGAEPRELVWEYWQAGAASLPDLRPNNPRFAKAIQVWRRLPVPLTTFLGPHIVRNIP
jgi:FemAB-related protein (PEP-CTERM system-associated)